MTSPRKIQRTRGSALLMAIILVGVLSVIGVAAVVLGSQERQNAAGKSRLDRLQACAAAAQAKIWAEVAAYGPSYLTSSAYYVTGISLPDGTSLAAPAHYDTTLGSTTISSVVLTVDTATGTGASGDLTNGGRLATAGATIYRIVATCTDRNSHQFETELSLRLAL